MSQLAAKVPVGFRFHPTDEELVGYYLPKKVGAMKIDLDLIRDLDLYKLEPWDLQGEFNCEHGFQLLRLQVKSAFQCVVVSMFGTYEDCVDCRAVQDPGGLEREADGLLLLQPEGQEVPDWEPREPRHHEGILEGHRARQTDTYEAADADRHAQDPGVLSGPRPPRG